MKCKEQKQPIITSSAEGSIAEILVTDRRVSDSMPIYLFTTIQYDRTNNSLRFISLRELWEHGIFVKRYLEYPEITLQECEGFLAEIDVYLQQGEYVTHHIDENNKHKFSNLLLITDISLDTREISFWSWTDIGTLEVYNISFDEYYTMFLSSIPGEKEVARFDIFHLVQGKEICENHLEKMIGYVRRGRIRHVDRIRCIRKICDENIAKFIQVLCEWFEVYVLIVRRLYEKGILSQDVLWKDADKILFAPQKNNISKKQFMKILKRYNKLLKTFELALIRGRGD